LTVLRSGHRAALAVATTLTLATALVIGSSSTSARGAPGSGTRSMSVTKPAAIRARSDPPAFILLPESGQVQLRSATSGRLIKIVGKWGHQVTNSSPVLSPDGQWIYATLLRSRQLIVERFSTVTGNARRLAIGETPAVSGDGRYLAYGTGKRGYLLAIRNLRSGRTRIIDLHAQIGPDASLGDGGTSITWLSDSRIVVVPGPNGVAASTTPSASPGPSRRSTCSPIGRRSCLIVLNLAAAHPGRDAGVVLGPAEAFIIGVAPTPNMLLVTAATRHGWVIDRVKVSDTSADVAGVMPLSSVSLPLVFDPEGRQLMYLRGHGPTALWTAAIGSHRLRNTHLLLSDVQLDGAGW
jgi:hypothetical protein